MSTGSDALAYKNALLCGAITIAEVIVWADKIISSDATPNPLLFDVSLSKNHRAMVSALGELSQDVSPTEAVPKTLSLFALSLANGSTNYDSIANTLYQMAISGLAPDNDAESLMFSFSDELNVAQLGYYGTPEEVKQEIFQFLSRYASNK